MKKTLVYLLIISLLLLSSQGVRAQRWYSNTDEIGRAIDHNIQKAKDSILLLGAEDSVFLLDYENETSRYICSYVNAYFGPPEDINFLISGFDRSQNGGFMRSVYPMTFHLLEKYRDDLLIYADDSVTAIFYKTIDVSNLAAASVCVKPDKDNYGKFLMAYSFYDKDGYTVYREEIEEQYRKEHYAIIRKYDDWLPAIQLWPNNFPHEMFFLEYTLEQGLVNAETREPVDIDKSEYYKEVEQWMRETCKKNGYSKMIISSPIPSFAPFTESL
ncbi:MAG: hypothetical protein LBG19_02240 [Prevotellaceae bacterium]|nr:hypothetical protein [Prevotellaceae bacterium]